MSASFHTSHRSELSWQDDIDILSLGQGVQVKIMHRDSQSQHTDMLVKFPPGYIEPRHTHAATHSVVVLEGVQVVEGEELRPGDYLWADGTEPHGPFEYPEGCVVFASFRGPSSQHQYPGSPAGEGGEADDH